MPSKITLPRRLIFASGGVVLIGMMAGTLLWLRLHGEAGQPQNPLLHHELCLRQGIQAADILQTVPTTEDEWAKLIRSASSTVTSNPVTKSYSFSDYGLHFKLPAEWEVTSTVGAGSNSYLWVRISTSPLRIGFSRLPIADFVAGQSGWSSLVPEVLISAPYPHALKELTFVVGAMQYRLSDEEGFVFSRDSENLLYLLSTLKFTCTGR